MLLQVFHLVIHKLIATFPQADNHSQHVERLTCLISISLKINLIRIETLDE